MMAAIKTLDELKRAHTEVVNWHSMKVINPEPLCEGCWCGGRGGREEKWVRGVDGIPDTLVFTDYCICTVGKHTLQLERPFCNAIWRRHDEADLKRLWSVSGVPPHYDGFTFETFPATPDTQRVIETIVGTDEMCGNDEPWWMVDEHCWLYLHGPYGTGKTGLAVATMRAKMGLEIGEGHHTYRGLFITVPDLLAKLRQSYDAARGSGGATEAELMESLYTVPLLVLDDLGAERATDWAVERLFSVVNRRHDYHLQTIITSNLNPKQLAQHLGERIVWRVLEMCRRGEEDGAAYVLEVRGPNLRERGRPPVRAIEAVA